MPLLSVVLVVHREQGFIEECVSSIAGDAQIVVVDDASPDHGPALLDALAARDERLDVHHLAERIGVGAARDLALEHATGEFVWFVETTDLLLGGAVASVTAALRGLDPDVLLLDHERHDPLGRVSPGPHRRVVRSVAEAEPGPLDRHPGVARMAVGAFDKVLRRELAGGFAHGRHAELPVVWGALLRAERIAALPDPVYARRRPGNAVRHGRRSDVLDHYERVLVLDGPPARRALVRPAAAAHLLAVADRAPRPERRAFLTRAGELLRAHGGDAPLSRRAALVADGKLRALAAVDAAAAVRRRARAHRTALGRRRRRAGAALRRRRLRRHYEACRRKPLDRNLSVFAAYWYRSYSCNPRAIYEKAQELVPGFRGVWIVERDAVDALPPGVEHVVAGTPEYFDVLARATYFVNNVNFPNHLVKRPGQVHVMTHHGTPLKRMGLDLRDNQIAGRRMDFDALLRRCARWDYSVSSNPLSSVYWERVFPVRHETLEAGYPRNDALANATENDVRRVRAELGIEPGRTAVLYAPTHREYRKGYVPTMDVARVTEALGEDFVLLARLHYFYGEDPVIRELHRAGRLVDVAAHPSIEELCLAADVLVTDYSSLMFDYGVLDRPILIHAPDWEVYVAMRGTTFDLMEEPPGVVARTDDEVVDALVSGAYAAEDATRARAAFRARFCALDDGRASERVVRRVWLGEPLAAPAPPAAVLR